MSFGLQSPLQLLGVFSRWQIFGHDVSLSQQFAHIAVVLDVFTGDAGLALQVLLFDLGVGDFVGEVLRACSGSRMGRVGVQSG